MRIFEHWSLGSRLLSALRSPRQGRFFFIVNNRNHVRIFAPIVHRLVELSVPCIITDIERESGDRGARRALAAAGLSSIGLEALKKQIGRRDVLVVANDFYPNEVIATMDLSGRRGALRIGVVEGCRFMQSDRYRRVDHLLAWSASCREAFTIPVHVVGSPIVEEAQRSSGESSTVEFVVINFKHPGPTLRDQQDWLLHATAACRAIAIPFQISVHPSYLLPAGFAAATQKFQDLMTKASVLISQPSTVVFEAMAIGKPTVLFPSLNEPLVEFADPKGAFEIARDPVDLPTMLRTALAGKDNYRDRCRAFFEFHVNIDPHISATQRIVQTLIDLADKRIGSRVHSRSVRAASEA
jgi:hypothetical protein